MEHIKKLIDPESIDWQILYETNRNFMQDAIEKGDEFEDIVEDYEKFLQMIEDKDIDKIIERFGVHTPDYLFCDYETYNQSYRISDINIYSGRGGGLFVRCKIDGVQQMGRQMNKLDVVCMQDDRNRDVIAARYFKDVLMGEGQERQQGMKRWRFKYPNEWKSRNEWEGNYVSLLFFWCVIQSGKASY